MSYQATYDAIRNRFPHVDAEQIMGNVMRQSGWDISFAMSAVKEEFLRAAAEQQRPFMLLRPAISIDGNQWCALYGENLQDGVAGFGDTPADAANDFDNNWFRQKISRSKP